jgi:hypothetical protein
MATYVLANLSDLHNEGYEFSFFGSVTPSSPDITASICPW